MKNLNSILVVGSRPEPTIPDTEYGSIVYVNGSIGLSNKLNVNGKYVIHVFSTSILFGSSELVLKTRLFFENKKVNKAVILTYFADKSIEDIKSTLEKLNYIYDEIEVYTPAAFEKSFLIFSNYRYYSGFVIGLFNPLFSFEDKLVTLKAYLKGKKHLSTGLLSVFYLLSKYPEQDITVSGIGIITGGYSYMNNMKRGHTYKDFVALRLLQSSQYINKLFFTEKELRTVLGLK